MRHGPKRSGRGQRWLWFGLLAPLTLAAGCASFIEQVSSKDFQFKDLFVRPNPNEVLGDPNSDGTKRAAALRQLREGQDQHLQILVTAATARGEEPLCRMSAIKALGHYKDPRAAQALRDVYLQDLPYPPDLVSILRQQTLIALADTGQDSARELLMRVAKEPPSAGSFKEQQETIDRRLAAIRGLGKFHDPDALETLLFVLKTDQDVAVGHRAGEALQTATGLDLPPSAELWERELHAKRGNGQPAPPPSSSVQQATHRVP